MYRTTFNLRDKVVLSLNPENSLLTVWEGGATFNPQDEDFFLEVQVIKFEVLLSADPVTLIFALHDFSCIILLTDCVWLETTNASAAVALPHQRK